MDLGYGPPDKWLRLLVTGHSVGRELGEEIILATTQPEMLQTNDKVWMRLVARTLECETDEYGYITYESGAAFRERVGGLELTYLGNSQIASNALIGPHGWIDWDGKIGCGSYNLGKYPDLDLITEDLGKIAERFPDLQLWVQTLESEGDGPVCGEWKVSRGYVERYEELNYRHVTTSLEPDVEGAVIAIATNAFGRERGVEAETLRKAYARVRRDT
jgi:hypothetical protein